MRTALNLRVSWWRRRRREVTLAAVGDQDTGSAVSLPGPVDPQLMRLLAGLPERQRQVIALRIFLDLDVAGTAATLGIAPGTVRAHQARGIATLRACLPPGSPQSSPQPSQEGHR